MKRMKNRTKTPIMLMAVFCLSMVLAMPIMVSADLQNDAETIKLRCEKLGVSYETLQDYADRYPDFDSVRTGLIRELRESGYDVETTTAIYLLVDEENARRQRELSRDADYMHKIEAEKKASDTRSFLNGKNVKLYARSAPSGKMYGSVTTKDVADKIKETYDIYIDKRSLNLPDIKNPGTYNFTVTFPDGRTAVMSVEVLLEQ